MAMPVSYYFTFNSIVLSVFVLLCASKSVEIVWAEIYWGRLFFRAESSLIQSSCRSFIGDIVPYEISKVKFRVETKNYCLCQYYVPHDLFFFTKRIFMC
jgi:hypothetical protein